MGEKNDYREFTRELSFKLRLMRESLDLNANEMADKCGTSNTTISLWESGKENPNLLYCEKLAKLCSMSLDDLILDKKEFVKKLYF